MRFEREINWNSTTYLLRFLTAMAPVLRRGRQGFSIIDLVGTTYL